MNLFADLLAASNGGKATATGPRIQQRRGVEVKSARELKIMAEASRIVATVLREIMGSVEPGQTTGDLDALAERRIREMGATPSFKGYHGFPASICASINNEVVHGIPSNKRVIRNGDLLKVDTGAYFDGYHGDSCITICVGDAPEEAQTLSRVARESLMAGLAKSRLGTRSLTLLVPWRTTLLPMVSVWSRTTPVTVLAAICTRSHRCSIFAPMNSPT